MAGKAVQNVTAIISKTMFASIRRVSVLYGLTRKYCDISNSVSIKLLFDLFQKRGLIDFRFHSLVFPLLPSFADSLTHISVSNIEKKIRVNRINCLIALRKLGL